MIDRSIDGTPATSEGSSPLLDVRRLTVAYGGAVAVDEVSFSVAPNSICGLIGPNGAGKTTLFNCISGLVRPRAGSVMFGSQNLIGRPARRIAELGIARTFQNVLLLGDLTIRENIAFGAASQRRFRLGRAALGRDRAQNRAALDGADALMAELGMTAIAQAYPNELPFGSLKRAELARAVMARPTLLLLDEPANGLSAGEVEELGGTLERLKQEYRLTIVLVEHHMGLVQRVADHVVVLDSGRRIAEGPPSWVCQQPQVITAYLGAAS